MERSRLFGFAASVISSKSSILKNCDGSPGSGREDGGFGPVFSGQFDCIRSVFACLIDQLP